MAQGGSLLDQLLGAGRQALSGQGGATGSGTGTQPGANPLGGLGGLNGANLGQLLEGKGGLAAGAAAGGLVGLLLGGKKARKIAGTALKVGGAAAVGGLAYKAWRDWQANRPATPSPQETTAALPAAEGTAFLPADPAARDDLALRLVRAMVAAAKADGHVTPDERARISAQFEALGLGPDARAVLEAELARPLDLGEIAGLAHTPEEAAEVYAASLLAVDPEGPAEKGYLAMLAARLQLDPGLVAHLHANAAALAGQEG